MASLSIIVVTHESASFIVPCLSSVTKDTEGIDAEIIVVDNCSRDDTVARVGEAFPSVHIHPLDRNVGFGRACNLAAAHARGPYLLFLNPDTIVHDGAIRGLVDLARRLPDAGIWGGRLLNPDGSPQAGSCGRLPSLWGMFCVAVGVARLFPATSMLNGGACVLEDGESAIGVDVVSGCMMMVARKLWDDLGGFDPAYFMYSEEVDLCRRARDLGARPVAWPKASVTHYGGVESSSDPAKRILLLRGKMTYMKRHWSRRRRLAGTALLMSWVASRCLALAVLRRIGRRASLARRAGLWLAVWSARREWLQGFAEIDGRGRAD